MATLPEFKDDDVNLRMARRIAHRYLYHIRLRSPALNGQTSSPRNLYDTLVSELNLARDDEAMQEIWWNMRDTKPHEYDPLREKQEMEELERLEQEGARLAEFRKILDALVALADLSQPVLPADAAAAIVPVLENAPAFLAQRMLPKASEDSIKSRDNLKQVDSITRQINAQLYPGLDDPNSAEYTSSDHHHTRHVLHYVHQANRVAELALNDVLTAVHEINAAFEGRGPLRSNGNGLQP